MNKYLLFDYGASHGRCILGIFHGDKIELQEIYDFDNRPVKFAGRLYWDILRLASELKIGMQMALKAHPDIECVGIDTWGCDFGFIDADGKLLGSPANYRDELRYQFKDMLENEYGAYELYYEAGANTNNIMGIYHLYGLTRTNAAELKAADRLLMIPDLLNYYLTGIATNEYTDATMFLGVNQQQKAWSKDIIQKLGFEPKWFGELSMPGTVLGNIKADICEEFEVPALPVVHVASHDSASAMAGVPIGDDKVNWCYLSIGTWALIGIESDKLYNSPESFPSGFGTQGGCEGKNNFVNLITGLWVIQQCAEKWKRELGSDFSWDKIVAAAAAAKRGFAYFDPNDTIFSPPSADMPKVVQEYCAKTGQQVPQTVGEVAACVYESLVMVLKEAYNNLRQFTGQDYEVLHMIGGGSKNKLLCQWMADALGIPVKAGPAETTAVGNLLMQMKAMNAIGSLSEGRKIASRSFVNEISTYLPQDTAYWDGKYADYQKICAMNR